VFGIFHDYLFPHVNFCVYYDYIKVIKNMSNPLQRTGIQLVLVNHAKTVSHLDGREALTNSLPAVEKNAWTEGEQIQLPS
jgi:hypothetical protein